MKKFLSILFVTIMVLALCTGCSDSESGKSDSDSSSDDALRVALMIPGSLGDKSFFDSANEGMTLIEENYGCETKVVEMGLDVDKYVPALEDIIDEGYEIIITGGSNIATPMTEVAAEYPDTKFILYDETVDFEDGQNSNVYCMTYRSNEGSYLAGVLAALVTESDEMPSSDSSKHTIGFAGGYDIPLINDFLVGYIQGALSVDPDIKVGIGYMSSFTDAATGKEVGVALYNQGIDVVFQAGGGAGLGVLDAAKEAGKYAIGTDSDQSSLFASDEEKANAILTSVLKRVDRSINIAIGEYIDGNLEFGTSGSFGMSESCIELCDNEYYENNVPEEIREQVQKAYDKLQTGEIVVDSATGSLTEDEVADLKKQVGM